MKKKIAVIGSNSFIAKYFIKNFSYNFIIDEYSHKPNRNQIYFEHIVDTCLNYEAIIFFSCSSNNTKILKILNYLSDKFNNRLIYISTTSMYSSFISRYTNNKLNEEVIVKKFSKWIIIRTGFVDYHIKNSFSNIFNDKKRKLVIFLIGGNLKTYFIYLPNLASFIFSALYLKKNKTYVVYDCIMTINEYMKIKKFRGFLFNIYLPKVNFLSSFISKFKNFYPSFLSSFFSLYFMILDKQLSDEYHKFMKNNFFYRRIFISDFYRYNKDNMPKNIYFLSSVFKYFHISCNIEKYRSLKSEEKFMFHLRLSELKQLKELSDERNSQKKINF